MLQLFKVFQSRELRLVSLACWHYVIASNNIVKFKTMATMANENKTNFFFFSRGAFSGTAWSTLQNAETTHGVTVQEVLQTQAAESCQCKESS
jgi:hypothetical protein